MRHQWYRIAAWPQAHLLEPRPRGVPNITTLCGRRWREADTATSERHTASYRPRCQKCIDLATVRQRKRAKDAPWVVYVPAGFHCERCGATEAPTLPAPVPLFVASMDAFVDRHLGCQEARP